MPEVALLIFVVFMLSFAACLIIEGITLSFDKSFIGWLQNHWKGLRGVRKDQLLAKGEIKSEAWKQGYCDMAYAIYENTEGSSYTSTYYFDNSRGATRRFPEDSLRSLAKDTEGLRRFKPSMGRKKNAYVSSDDSQQFQDYYAGGMVLLSDVDDFQAIILEENNIVARRLAGLEDSDRRYLETKKQLDILRDKTFNRAIEHKEFDEQMGVRRRFWQKKEVA